MYHRGGWDDRENSTPRPGRLRGRGGPPGAGGSEPASDTATVSDEPAFDTGEQAPDTATGPVPYRTAEPASDTAADGSPTAGVRTDGGRLSASAVIDGLPDATVLMDDDERIQLVNPAFEALFDLSAGTVEGQSLRELIEAGVISAESVDAFRAVVDSLDTGESARFEITFSRAGQGEGPRFDVPDSVAGTDGGRNTFESSDQPTDGVVPGDQQSRPTDRPDAGNGPQVTTTAARVATLSAGQIVVTFRDVTERRRTEAALEALHETAQAFTEAREPEAIASRAVEAARAVLGFEATAIYLYDERSASLEPAAATDGITRLIDELPTFTGGDSIAWEVYQSGEERFVPDLTDAPNRYSRDTRMRSELLLPLGEFGVFLVGTTHHDDFADWQRSVARVLAADTARALSRAGREAELRARQAELERQNDRLDTLASVVSHDLRNPLNVAAGNLELVRMDDDSERLAAVSDALDRAEAIVEDVLTIAREGAAVEQREPVDVGALARECWTSVATDDARLAIADPPTVAGDRRRLRHLLENLLANSAEHAPGADPDAPSQQTPITVEVGGCPDGFYVADDGVGIPPERRRQLFDPTAGDIGLGLDIVQQMAQAHGWSVRATESADGGARFEIVGVESADADSPTAVESADADRPTAIESADTDSPAPPDPESVDDS